MFKTRLGPDPDWVQVSREWEESGLKQETFCEERGYSYSRFKLMRGRLNLSRPTSNRKMKRPSAPKSEVLDFLPVSVAAENPSQAQFFNSEMQGKTAPVETELKVELPFGVILRFRGVGQK